MAETYVKFIASTAVNGNVSASNQYLSLIAKIQEYTDQINNPYEVDKETLIYLRHQLMRIPDALSENNERAGYEVFSNNQIHIQSTSNLNTYEKYALLMMCTANVTFNSFAAEVKFHSDALLSFWAVNPTWYNAALRADMALGEDRESGLFDQYYDLEGDLVQEQIRYHGEY